MAGHRINIIMGTVINMQQYKLHKHKESFVQSIADTVKSWLTAIFTFFLENIAYPIIAAVATVRKKKVTVINY